MKIGVNAFIFTTQFGEADFPLLKGIVESGFDAFEIPVFNPSNLNARAIRLELDACGLDRTVCAILPEGINPISEDRRARSGAIEHLKKCIELTASLGATIMAGPLYAPVGHLTGRRRTPEEFSRAVECFQELTGALDSHNVTIALEPLNRFETYFMTTANDAAEFCDAVGHSRVGAMLDTFHTNIEEKDVPHAFRNLGTRLKHVHVSENDRGIPGTGHVDFPGIIQALDDMQYDGFLTIESFRFTHPALAKATAIWRDLAPSPASIAFEGLKYLRSLSICRSRNRALHAPR